MADTSTDSQVSKSTVRPSAQTSTTDMSYRQTSTDRLRTHSDETLSSSAIRQSTQSNESEPIRHTVSTLQGRPRPPIVSSAPTANDPAIQTLTRLMQNNFLTHHQEVEPSSIPNRVRIFPDSIEAWDFASLSNDDQSSVHSTQRDNYNNNEHRRRLLGAQQQGRLEPQQPHQLPLQNDTNHHDPPAASAREANGNNGGERPEGGSLGRGGPREPPDLPSSGNGEDDGDQRERRLPANSQNNANDSSAHIPVHRHFRRRWLDDFQWPIDTTKSYVPDLSAQEQSSRIQIKDTVSQLIQHQKGIHEAKHDTLNSTDFVTRLVVNLINMLASGTADAVNLHNLAAIGQNVITQIELQKANDTSFAKIDATDRMKQMYDKRLATPQMFLYRGPNTESLMKPKNILGRVEIFDRVKNPQQDFTPVWNSILRYTHGHQLTEQDYLSILSVVCKGPASADLDDMYTTNTITLERVLNHFHKLYCTRRTLEDDVNLLRNFQRSPQENIGQCMARASHLYQRIRPAAPSMQADWQASEYTVLQTILFAVVSPDTKKALAYELRQRSRQGACTSLDTLIEFVNEYEEVHAAIPVTAVKATYVHLPMHLAQVAVARMDPTPVPPPDPGAQMNDPLKQLTAFVATLARDNKMRSKSPNPLKNVPGASRPNNLKHKGKGERKLSSTDLSALKRLAAESSDTKSRSSTSPSFSEGLPGNQMEWLQANPSAASSYSSITPMVGSDASSQLPAHPRSSSSGRYDDRARSNHRSERHDDKNYRRHYDKDGRRYTPSRSPERHRGHYRSSSRSQERSRRSSYDRPGERKENYHGSRDYSGNRTDKFRQERNDGRTASRPQYNDGNYGNSNSRNYPKASGNQKLYNRTSSPAPKYAQDRNTNGYRPPNGYKGNRKGGKMTHTLQTDKTIVEIHEPYYRCQYPNCHQMHPYGEHPPKVVTIDENANKTDTQGK